MYSKLKMWLALITLVFISLPSQLLSQDVLTRTSLTEFAKDPAKVESLKQGIAVMKARKPSDPRSWFYQAAVHGISPDEVQAALARDPDVRGVDQARFWNQCPHNGQSSADFLIWHRAYLFYFERILREAAQDPKLSLPYWDYTGKDRRFPALLADPDQDPADPNGEPRNPLFDARREMAFMFGVYELSDEAVSIERAFNETEFFGKTEDAGFAGGVSDNEPLTQGLIERTPHNMIHFAVGGAIGDTVGLMGEVSTAALDPVFWLHHSNIDHLWSQWECGKERAWGAVPAEAWLNDKPWSFHDVDLSVQQLTRMHYLTYTSLNIRYDTDKPRCKRLSANQPRPAGDEAPRPFAPTRSKQVAVLDQVTKLSSTASVSKEIQIPGEFSSSFSPMVSAEKRRIVLELRGLDYEAPPSVGFEVYVNLPTGEEPRRSSPHFVGVLNLFGLKHAQSQHKEVKQALDITSIVNQKAFDPNKIRVTIVPFDLFKARSGAVPPLHRAGRVTIKAMGVIIADSQG
jgi:hypothetical protein